MTTNRSNVEAALRAFQQYMRSLNELRDQLLILPANADEKKLMDDAYRLAHWAAMHPTRRAILTGSFTLRKQT